MGWEGDTAAELLMVAGLARDVPIAAKALEGNHGETAEQGCSRPSPSQ